jgi:hypothetical protein
LGVSVHHQADGLFLTQRQFALDILEHAGMVDCKPVSMPMDMHAKVSTTFRPPVADPTQIRSLTGALQYLTFTRPDITDITYVVYIIQKGNTDVKINLYMGINDEKGKKIMKNRKIEDFIFYLSFRSSVLSKGIHWVSW